MTIHLLNLLCKSTCALLNIEGSIFDVVISYNQQIVKESTLLILCTKLTGRGNDPCT